MVRQYRIHTDLDGAENKIYDMTNGLIRFYQPSDLGIINSTNIWQSQGIGVMGNNNISHPDIDFKFETFGSSLEENYRIFNEFINSIIKQKYITLEYTNEIGTFYADVQLSKITKTEGYGFDGQFSETISFIPVNMWYVYEQLKFSKVQNGEIGGNTKIYGNKETTIYPNLNLEQHTKMLVDENNKLLWGSTGSATDTITYEAVNIPTSKGIVNGVHVTQTTSGQAGWRSPSYSVSPYTEVGNNTQVSRSAYIKNNATTSLGITLTIGYSENANGSSAKYSNTILTIPANSDFSLYKDTFNLPSTAKYIWFYIYTQNPTASADFTFAGYKAEWGGISTPWMPSESEVTPNDYRNYGSYKYDYTYFGEDNIERFSKWKIDDGIFSFTARMTPSQNVENMSDYGVRFLDEQFNEYTALIFGNTTKPDSIQFNTDVNDEYYQAQIGTSTINMFSALNYQRFRTRFIQKGTMELVNVDVVEMNVKRKVEFV